MSCQSTATETQFTTVTGTTVITSTSTSLSTLSDTTSTILSTSCLASVVSTGNATSNANAAAGSCTSSTIITSTTVIDGGVSTVQVPFEVTSTFTSVQATKTLFSECTTTNGGDENQNTPTTTTTPTSTTTNPPTSTTTSDETTIFSDQTFTTLSTPTTTLTTSQDSTLADGQVTQVLVTVISTLAPTSVVQTSQVAIQTNTSSDSSSSSNVGAIAGGVVGGFVGLLALVGLIWYFIRRRRNWDDIFEKDYDEYMKPQPVKRGHMLDMEDEPIRPANVNVEPKPYVYGLVGAANTPPPNTLGAGLASVPPPNNNNRLSVGHNRTPSETPLMMNRSAPNTPGSRSSIGPGLSPAPSLAPSVAGGRSGSPGPLGVAINTGPSLSMSYPEPDSPTSPAPRGPLFIANQTDDIVTPPGSPAPNSPGTPGSAGVGRSSLNLVHPGPSFAGAMSGKAPPTVSPPPQSNLQHNISVSSQSVYSQASASTVQQMPAALREARRQSGVIVHTDGGRVDISEEPPSYKSS